MHARGAHLLCYACFAHRTEGPHLQLHLCSRLLNLHSAFVHRLAAAVLPFSRQHGQTVLEQTLALRADRRTWHGLTDRTGNRFLAATGEQPLGDEAWDALLARWDGYAVLLLPPESAQPAGDAHEAAADAPEARAFEAVSESLW